MANEDYGTVGDDIQNPADWFDATQTTVDNDSNYRFYDNNGNKALIDCTGAFDDTSIDVNSVAKGNCDIREMYHGVMYSLEAAYAHAKSIGTKMPENMVMTKSTVKNITPSGSQSTQTHVYTFRITENIATNFNNIQNPATITAFINPDTISTPALPNEVSGS